MAGNVKLMTSAGGGVVLDTATTTATDVTVKVPVTGVNNGTLVCSDASGNVGIGTSSPFSAGSTYKVLTINGTGGGQITWASNGTSKGYAFCDASNMTWGANSVSTFETNGAERMRIDSSGNLLVGTTSFATGQDAITFGTTNRVFSRSGTSNAYQMQFANANGYVGRIETTNSSTTYTTSSDYRLKENIQPMQNALGVVAQLNPVTYTWKADGSDGQGFIAHELQAVVPDCVTGEKDAVDAENKPVYQGIDTSFLVATLTKAIQELNEKIEAQAAEIAALKGAA